MAAKARTRVFLCPRRCGAAQQASSPVGLSLHDWPRWPSLAGHGRLSPQGTAVVWQSRGRACRASRGRAGQTFPPRRPWAATAVLRGLSQKEQPGGPCAQSAFTGLRAPGVAALERLQGPVGRGESCCPLPRPEQKLSSLRGRPTQCPSCHGREESAPHSTLTWHRVQDVVQQHKSRVPQHRADLEAERAGREQTATPKGSAAQGSFPEGRGSQSCLEGALWT